MRTRDNRRRLICYPEDDLKGYWDLFISLVLIMTCSITPFMIAFYDETDASFTVFDMLTDIFFMIDIIVIFFSAYYDSDFNLIDNYAEIACNYFRGWFLLDLIAIIPFNYLVNSQNNINEFARIFRIGRLYKLVKLLRLVRVLKIIN